MSVGALAAEQCRVAPLRCLTLLKASSEEEND